MGRVRAGGGEYPDVFIYPISRKIIHSYLAQWKGVPIRRNKSMQGCRSFRGRIGSDGDGRTERSVLRRNFAMSRATVLRRCYDLDQDRTMGQNPGRKISQSLYYGRTRGPGILQYASIWQYIRL